MSLRDILNEVKREHGDLTPKAVVETARDPSHPLHDRFEWDDSVAGEMYRQVQARRLIRTARVTYSEGNEQDPPKQVRAFHAVRTENGNVYRDVDEITADEFTLALVRADMEREWKQLFRRYSHFEEFVELVRADVDAA